MGTRFQRVETPRKIATRALRHRSIAGHSFRFQSAVKGIFLHRNRPIPRSRSRGHRCDPSDAFSAEPRSRRLRMQILAYKLSEPGIQSRTAFIALIDDLLMTSVSGCIKLRQYLHNYRLSGIGLTKLTRRFARFHNHAERIRLPVSACSARPRHPFSPVVDRRRHSDSRCFCCRACNAARDRPAIAFGRHGAG